MELPASIVRNASALEIGPTAAAKRVEKTLGSMESPDIPADMPRPAPTNLAKISMGANWLYESPHKLPLSTIETGLVFSALGGKRWPLWITWTEGLIRCD